MSCCPDFSTKSRCSQGSETTNTSYIEYEIFIGSDSLWTFTITKSLKCPSNYKLFTRAKGLWCIGKLEMLFFNWTPFLRGTEFGWMENGKRAANHQPKKAPLVMEPMDLIKLG
ncbi:Protein CBG16283 [Caenorhabditis briggsae]|uniref:Protein CBG16283 n=1 Tax=Caenorhabditis briggsae TaxID=6238 RepID=A8XNR2_CAEBR|nr:Protein CBG16283 [Caenorhabditis briggsae]CAP34151.1 Protein CBG16283 [Caenorhabditis briggsae]